MNVAHMFYTVFLILLVVAAQEMISLSECYKEIVSVDFNITQFNECTNTTRDEVLIWIDEGGELIFTPHNDTYFDEEDQNLWLNCIGEQNMDTIFSVSDGTYVEEYQPFALANGQSTFPWTATRYSVYPPSDLGESESISISGTIYSALQGVSKYISPKQWLFDSHFQKLKEID